VAFSPQFSSTPTRPLDARETPTSHASKLHKARPATGVIVSRQKWVACHNRGESRGASYWRRDGKATKKKKSREQTGAPTVPCVWETVRRTGVVRWGVACMETAQRGCMGYQMPSMQISAGQDRRTAPIPLGLGPILGLRSP
jgi:hypothetical protein